MGNSRSVMAMRRIGFVIALMFLLTGCGMSLSTTSTTVAQTTTVTTTTTTSMAQLSAPQNLRIEDKVLLWDAVSNATTYLVTIDDVGVLATESFYSLEEQPYRVMVVSVVAKADGYRDSVPTAATLEHAPNLLAPSGIRISNGFLWWDAVPEAMFYLLNINGTELLISGSNGNPPVELAYDLSLLNRNEYHTIRVVAGHLGWLSPASATIVFDGSFDFAGTFSLSHSLALESDLQIDLGHSDLELFDIEGEGYESGGLLRISYQNGIVVFHQDYLEELAYGDFTFTLTTSYGIFDIQLNIHDTRKPYMLSSSQINVAIGFDVILDFALFDGVFASLSGNGIVATDYAIDGSRLTINAAYIDFIFARDPDRTVLILGYTLSANDNITIGYLFIRRPSL
jgi:hypothetical protein